MQSEMHCPTLGVLKGIASLCRDFRGSDIGVMVQETGKKNRHKTKPGARAIAHGPQLVDSKPGIGTDEIEIKIDLLHHHRR